GVQDGIPKSSVDVELHDPTGRVRARGTTNAQGLVRLAGLRDTSENGGYVERGFAGYVSARLALDRAVVSINSWSGDLSPWRFNIGSAWGADRLPVAAAVFTERGIYRPGEPVYAKAIVRNGALGALRVPAAGDARHGHRRQRAALQRRLAPRQRRGAVPLRRSDGPRRRQLDTQCRTGHRVWPRYPGAGPLLPRRERLVVGGVGRERRTVAGADDIDWRRYAGCRRPSDAASPAHRDRRTPRERPAP